MSQTSSQGQGACAAPAQAKRGRPKTRQTVTYACQTCKAIKTVKQEKNRVYKYCSMACIRGKRTASPNSKNNRRRQLSGYEKKRRKDNRTLSHTNMKLRGRCALHPIYNAGTELIVDDNNLPMFCWDHIDRTQKTANVARMMGKSNELLIQQEIDKCQLLCHNCHAMKGMQEGDHYSIAKQTNKQETLFDL